MLDLKLLPSCLTWRQWMCKNGFERVDVESCCLNVEVLLLRSNPAAWFALQADAIHFHVLRPATCGRKPWAWLAMG